MTTHADDTMPQGFRPAEGHDVLYAFRYSKDRRPRPWNVIVPLVNLAVLSIIVVPLTIRFVTPALTGGSFWPLLGMVPLTAFMVWIWRRSRGSGIVVDTRGVHASPWNATGAFIPHQDIDSFTIRSSADKEFLRTVASLRYRPGEKGYEHAHVELETPMGDHRAVIGVDDSRRFIAAVEEAKRRDRTVWREPRASGGSAEPDIDIEVVDGGALFIRTRRWSRRRTCVVAAELVLDLQVVEDPTYLRELAWRLDDDFRRRNYQRKGMAMGRFGEAWGLVWAGRKKPKAAVLVVQRSATGGRMTSVIGTSAPDAVARAIAEACARAGATV